MAGIRGQQDSVAKINLGSFKPLGLAQKGEHEIQLVNVNTEHAEDDTSPRLNAKMKFVQLENIKPMYHTLWLPKPGDSDDDVETTLRRLFDFARAFKIDTTKPNVNFTSGYGNKGFGMVDRKKDSGYPEKNVLKYMINED